MSFQWVSAKTTSVISYFCRRCRFITERRCSDTESSSSVWLCSPLLSHAFGFVLTSVWVGDKKLLIVGRVLPRLHSWILELTFSGKTACQWLVLNHSALGQVWHCCFCNLWKICMANGVTGLFKAVMHSGVGEVILWVYVCIEKAILAWRPGQSSALLPSCTGMSCNCCRLVSTSLCTVFLWVLLSGCKPVHLCCYGCRHAVKLPWGSILILQIATNCSKVIISVHWLWGTQVLLCCSKRLSFSLPWH